MGYTHGVRYSEEDVCKKIMEVANTFDPVRMPSRKELEDYYGDTSLTNKIARNGGHYYWANKLGLEVKYSETKLGIHAEKHIRDILADMGFDVRLTPTKHPYDLLVNGCVKVDVKAANKSFVHGSEVRAYRLAKREQTCDIYIFCETNDDTFGDAYVVPSSVVTGQVQVEMGIAKTIYEKYKNRYDIVQNFVNFYKLVE